MKDRLTIMTPVALFSPQRLRDFELTIRSLYSSPVIAEQRPLHLISPAGTSYMLSQMREILAKVKANYHIIAQGATAFDAAVAMIKEVQTPYAYMQVSDVLTMTTKDFFTPAMDAMSLDKSIAQVRISGHPFSDTHHCWAPFETSNKNLDFITMREFPHITWIPLEVHFQGTYNTVWRHMMTPDLMRGVYGIPIWSTIMRSDILKKISEIAARERRPQDRTLTHFSYHPNGGEDLVQYDVPRKGWPASFKFLEGYQDSSLNLCCYTYAIGYEENKMDEFRKNNMVEIRNTGELNAAYKTYRPI